jgi:hypothetical protein
VDVGVAFLVGFVDVEAFEVVQVDFDVAVLDLDVDDQFFLADGGQEVGVYVFLLELVGEHLVLEQFGCGVFGLGVQGEFGGVGGGNFNEHDAALAGFGGNAGHLVRQLHALFVAVLEVLQAGLEIHVAFLFLLLLLIFVLLVLLFVFPVLVLYLVFRA